MTSTTSYDEAIDLEPTSGAEAYASDKAAIDTEQDDREENPVHAAVRRHVMSRSIIAAFAAASAVAATLPLPLKDAVMLSPIELAEVNALASVYGIPQEESVRKILDAVLELGVASMAARGAIGILDKAPRLTLGAKAKSAVIAATIVAGIGLIAAYAFEQVHLGKLSLSELDIAHRLRNSNAWLAFEQSVIDALHGVMQDDTIEGLRVAINELAKAASPVA